MRHGRSYLRDRKEILTEGEDWKKYSVSERSQGITVLTTHHLKIPMIHVTLGIMLIRGKIFFPRKEQSNSLRTTKWSALKTYI